MSEGETTSQTHRATCHLCEAICGLSVEHRNNRVLSVRGDREDPFSKGHVCPKAAALIDLHTDPDRLRHPVRRRADGSFERISWPEALSVASERLALIQRRYGKNAVAVYLGNPTVHSYSAALSVPVLLAALDTQNFYSANSVDGRPRMVANWLHFGNALHFPIPDIERTEFLIMLGANPAISNGSLMGAPGIKRRLSAIRERGGQIVVVDPRRTETSALASKHLSIRPGTDAALLACMIRLILREGLDRPGRLARVTDGIEELRQALAPFSPAVVGPFTGLRPDTIEDLTRRFAAADRGVVYGRLGTCVQEFGALTSCLIDVLNLITGNLDRAGGAMFCSPAVDVGRLSRALGLGGGMARFRSRVSGLPEFNKELPVAALAEEIETPGEGQVHGLVVHAGNPVLSTPNGKRLGAALGTLDFCLAIDIYVNETTRHADLILPPTFGFEHDHYPLVTASQAVRNIAKYSEAFLKPEGDLRHDWQILNDLSLEIVRKRGNFGPALALLARPLLRRDPKRLLDLALRLGPYGMGRGGLSLDKLRRDSRGIDLGRLKARLPRALSTRRKRIRVASSLTVTQLGQLAVRLQEKKPDGELVLIGRRTLRSNNSWMHNSERLVKGPERCTLLIHPDDAAARGVQDGSWIHVRSEVGQIRVRAKVSSEMMTGVVSLPHGWGHGEPKTNLRVAQRHAGASVNDLTDPARIDQASGTSDLATIVEVAPS